MTLPDTLLQNLRAVHDDAEPWLEALPETLARLESDWKLRVTGPVPQLSYNLVLYAERPDKTPCILKLSPPNDEIVLEGEALQLYAGDSFCALLERDDGISALLLERVLPGLSLQEVWHYDDDGAHTRIVAELMVHLWREVPEPHPFCPLKSWARALQRPFESVPAALQKRAQTLLLELGPDKNPVLLHGDLHHGNILSSTNSTGASATYRAIDPKGIVGARGYDVGTYLLNPVQASAPELISLLPPRLKALGQVLGLEQNEIAAWGFVHAVLSACWDAKIPGDWSKRALAVARGLEPYL